MSDINNKSYIYDKVIYKLEHGDIVYLDSIPLIEEDAAKAIEQLKVEEILREHAYKFNYDEWCDASIDKYNICFNFTEDTPYFCSSDVVKNQGMMFFKSIEDCKRAVDDVGLDRLGKYFKEYSQ